MPFKVRIMLYVDDIELISNFWQKTLATPIIETNDLPENYQNLVLQLASDVELSLFPKDFIKKYSPEVLANTPSLMLFTEEFTQLKEKLNPNGEITTIGEMRTFNFADPEGNYFVIATKLN